MENRFMDVSLLEAEDGLSVTYRSGLTVYEEGFTGGQYVSYGWNAAGYVPQIVTNPRVARLDHHVFPFPMAFLLEVQGQLLHSHFRWISFQKEETDRGLLATVHLEHTIFPIAVHVHTLLDGTPVLTRWLTVSNTSDSEPMAISKMEIMSGGLQITKRYRDQLRAGSSLYRAGYMSESSWGREGAFQWKALDGNCGLSISGRLGRERFRHPMFILENNATGECFVGQLGYSGGYRFAFELDQDAFDARLSFSAGVDGFSPIRVLACGEKTQTPQFHFGMLFGGLDACVNHMHRHIRRSVFPQSEAIFSPVRGGIGPEMDMSQASVLSQIDKSQALGLEIFALDASWYMGNGMEDDWPDYVGDWFQPESRYALGIAGIRTYCHDRGIKFGLWMEPERVGKRSRALAEARDMLLTDYQDQTRGRSFDSYADHAGSYRAESMDGGYIDISKPAGAQWVEARICALIDTFELDYLRLDCNFSPGHMRCYNRQGNYLEDCNYRYYENWYGIFERLRKKYPQVIFENCAAGGGRTDLGMVQHMSHTQVTDCFLAPRTFSIVNGMTMCLPPERLDHLVGGCSAHVLSELDFNLRLMLFTRPSVGMVNERRYTDNPLHMSRIRHAVDLFKTFVRPMHKAGSLLYHHTPEQHSYGVTGTGILEYTAEDKRCGMLGVFALSDPQERELCVRLRGVDLAKQYWVTLDNSGSSFSISGYAMCRQGIPVSLSGALTSELILFTEQV